MSEVTEEQWMAESDLIFNNLSQSMDNLEQAKQALVCLYMPDMSFSRAGISHALKRLERHYDTTVDQ